MMVHRLASFCLAVLPFGCGGEVGSGPASPKGGCAAEETCPGASGNGGQGGGGAAGSGGAGVTAGSECTGAVPDPDPAHVWANWPMPNPTSSGGPNPSSYDLSQAEVVIDEGTGLMWQQTASPVDEAYSFEAAVDYCGALEVSGYCDWRLPTRIEATSLVDFTRKLPAADPAVFSDFPNSQADSGWTFFTSSLDEEYEWRTFFSDGSSVRVQRSIASQGSRARCVRTHVERAVPDPRYVIEGQAPGDVVLDQGTGLVWQRRPSQQTYTFSEAQAHCENLDLPGGGWRVPSMKEIQTLVDERSSPPFDTRAFPDLPRGALRTSSQSAECPEACAAWLLDGDGSVFYSRVDAGLGAHHYVRCVR